MQTPCLTARNWICLVVATVLSWAEQARTLVIAHTMGVVTFSLYTLFFSVVTKDERRTAFSLDVRQWLVCIGVSLSIIVVSESSCLVNAALLKGDKTRYPPAAGITPGRVATLRDRSNRMRVTSWPGRKGPHQLGLTAADQRTEPRRCGS